jgi:hypothetical protein
MLMYIGFMLSSLQVSGNSLRIVDFHRTKTLDKSYEIVYIRYS